MKIVNNYVSPITSTLSFAADVAELLAAQEADPTAVGGIEVPTPIVVGESKADKKTRIDKLVGVQTRNFQKAATAVGRTARIAGRDDDKEAVTLYFRLVEKIVKTRKPVAEVAPADVDPENGSDFVFGENADRNDNNA